MGRSWLADCQEPGFTGLLRREVALIWSLADSKSQPSMSVCACSICSRQLISARAMWLFHATCARISEPAELPSWGHVGSIKTSSIVSPMSALADGAILACRLSEGEASLGLKQPCSLLASLALQSGCAYLEPCRLQVLQLQAHISQSHVSSDQACHGETCFRGSAASRSKVLHFVR